jgi:hypothetical protein
VAAQDYCWCAHLCQTLGVAPDHGFIARAVYVLGCEDVRRAQVLISSGGAHALADVG